MGEPVAGRPSGGKRTEPGAGPNRTGGQTGPLVVACVRIVDLRPHVDPLTGRITRDPAGLGLPAPDAAALEHALRIGEVWSGRVVVVATGPSPAPGGTPDAVLGELAALGATVVHLAEAGPAVHGRDRDMAETALRHPGTERPAATDSGALWELTADEGALARRIVNALSPFGVPAAVLCGDRSPDRGTGALPGFLAHELGAAQALGAVAVAPGDGHLLVDRRLDGGWRERLRVPCPAVCSVEGGGVRLRRATLPALLAAGPTAVHPAAPVRGGTVDGAREGSGPGPVTLRILGPPRPYRPRTRIVAPPADPDPRIRLLELTGALEAHDPPTVLGPIGAPEAADALVDFLVRHGYLDAPLPGAPARAGAP